MGKYIPRSLNNKETSPKVEFPENLDPLDPKNYAKYSQHDYAPKFIIKAALRFIQKNKDHPFFLYFASPMPHASLQAPQKWVDYYLKKFGTDEKPYLGGSYFPCRYPHATRAAMVSLLDEHVGEIVSKLKELGIYKNTIIIFTGDNAPPLKGGRMAPGLIAEAHLKALPDGERVLCMKAESGNPSLFHGPGK